MPEPSWIFILAITTLTIGILLAVASYMRTRRDEKKQVKTNVERHEIDEARAEKNLKPRTDERR
ncbi:MULTISPECIES: hypothetical protein [unclassified Roseitalea]|uniref:hypothetical protein n=1 Tax=unclassified Roseitalea TaxID=2639107 RepID=UPI00273D36F9|nr:MULTISPECIES: hypothetical protein [unclassified Roseitalea]